MMWLLFVAEVITVAITHEALVRPMAFPGVPDKRETAMSVARVVCALASRVLVHE